MGVTITYGPAGSGKTTLCIKKIADILSRGEENVLLLVPEQLTFYMEKQLTDRLGYLCAGKAEVLSFERLAYRMISPGDQKVIDAAGKGMLLQRVCSRLAPELTYFSHCANQSGFLDDFMRLQKEWKQYSFESEKAKKMKMPDRPLLEKKMHDALLLFEAFEQAEENYFDSANTLRLLAEHLDNSDELTGYRVFIDEFSDFLPQYYEVIRRLIPRTREMDFYLCADSQQPDKFATGLDTLERLEQLCQSAHVSCQKMILTQVKKYTAQKNDLAHLERFYGIHPVQKYEKACKNIELNCYDNIYAEIETAAQKIWQLCRDEDYRFSDIAVVCPNVEEYLPFIRAIFDQYSINYFADDKVRASEHPIAMAIIGVFHIVLKNFETQSIFTYLKTGFSDLQANEVFLLENFALANRVIYQRWMKDDWWTSKLQRVSEEQRESVLKMDEIRRRAVSPLLAFSRRVKDGKKTVRSLSEAVYSFMEETHLYDKIVKMVVEFQEKGLLELADEYSRIYNAILHILDEMVMLFGEDNITLEEYCSCLEAGLSQYEFSFIPQGIDCIDVGDSVRTKIKNKKALFILGAVSGSFPQGASLDGVFSDAERVFLLQNGLDLAPDNRQKTVAAEFLVYKILSAPTEKLYISFPQASFDGQAVRPAEVVTKLTYLFPGLSLNKDDISYTSFEESRFIRPRPSFLYAVTGARYTFDQLPVSPAYWELWNWYCTQPSFQTQLKRVYLASSYGKKDDPILQEQLKILYRGDFYTSVHRIEQFAKCPFSYFAQYILKLRERKILEMAGRDYGIVIHEIIERFCNDVYKEKGDFKDVDLPYCRKKISDLVDSELQGNVYQDLNDDSRSSYLFMRLKKSLLYLAWIIVIQMSAGDFKILQHEAEFSDEGDLPALTISLEDGKQLRLSGFIDRVDEAKIGGSKCFRIIDYKSYNKRFSLGNILNGTDLQLMVYLDAFWDAKGIKPAGMFYFKLTDHKLISEGPLSDEYYFERLQKKFMFDGLTVGNRETVLAFDREAESGSGIVPVSFNKDGSISKNSLLLTQTQLEVLKAHTRFIMKELAQRILKGQIKASPCLVDGQDSCEFCSYGSVCHFDSSKDRYRRLKREKDSDIIKKINEEIEKKEKQ